MQPESENSPHDNSPQAVGGSPPLAATEPSPLLATAPPPLPVAPSSKPGRARRTFVVLLNICLGLFLADGVVSLIDDSLIVFLNVHALTPIRGLVFVPTLLMAGVIYVSMACTPMIPKRLFLPVTLFSPIAMLAIIPAMIFFFSRIQQIIWVVSFLQVVIGLVIIRRVQGARGFRWPLVTETALATGRFGWRRLLVWLLVNVVVLLPGIVVYLYFCAAAAVNHFSEGFLTLRHDGLVAQGRKYVRSDGRVIQLFPMAHIGDADFYRQLSESFPSNSIILMEGVTDDNNLLTNKITYQRMAQTLGLSEQQKEFKPRARKIVRADVDVSDFAPDTIDLLNLVMLVHSKGLNNETLLKMTQYAPPQHFEKQLFDDLLGKRNRRLLQNIRAMLSESEDIIVPWGAAHMPEVAREIEKAGFHLEETHDYVAIRFRSAGETGTKPRSRLLEDAK